MEMVIFMTASLDGRIATKEYDSQLSCPYDLQRLHEWRRWSDVLLVGANTAIIDDPGLFVKRVPSRREPKRGVVDGNFKVPHNLRLFKERPWQSMVITTWRGVKEHEEKYSYLKSLGVEFVIVKDTPPISGWELKFALAERGYRKIMIEGGGLLAWSLIKDRAVDRLEITYVGRVIGEGVSMTRGGGFPKVSMAPLYRVERAEVCKCGRCVHVSWVLDNNSK